MTPADSPAQRDLRAQRDLSIQRDLSTQHNLSTPVDPIDLTLPAQSQNTAEFWVEEDAFRQQFDKQIYQQRQKLGAGAMGEVHLVEDLLLHREVAYKQLLATNAAVTEADQQRFITEVKITAQLDHPYIVPIYSLEFTEQGPAYTMKRVAGQDLKAWIQSLQAGSKAEHQAALPDLLDTFLKVCDAVEFAHSRGVIHRDLKPANIMLGAHHEVYLMDWGIARPIGTATPYLFEDQEVGKVIGSPSYMSPEQVRAANSRLDGRSDLFAMGLILYELLSLQKAYPAKGMQALIKQAQQAELAPLQAKFGQRIAPELRAIVAKATAKKRADRYVSVQALADDLRCYLSGEAILALPENGWKQALRRFKPYRVRALYGLMFILIVSACLSAANLWQRQQILAQAYARERLQAQLFVAVNARTQAIDQKLLGVQQNLQVLAGLGSQALQYGQPSKAPYHLETRADFYANLPGVRQSTRYNNRLSLEAVAFAKSYQVPEAQLKPQFQILNALAEQGPELMVRSETGGAAFSGDWRSLIAEQGVPLMFLNLISKEGAYLYYPAIQYNTPKYEPRKRPFYEQALGHREIRCGKTYLDRIAGRLMPCSLALYDDQDQFIGVAAVDMQFNFLGQHLLDLADQPLFREAYLLNQAGEVIVKASDKNRQVSKQAQIHQADQLQPYPDAAIQARLKAGEKAGLIVQADRLLVFAQLHFQDWYYLAEFTNAVAD